MPKTRLFLPELGRSRVDSIDIPVLDGLDGAALNVAWITFTGAGWVPSIFRSLDLSFPRRKLTRQPMGEETSDRKSFIFRKLITKK